MDSHRLWDGGQDRDKRERIRPHDEEKIAGRCENSFLESRAGELATSVLGTRCLGGGKKKSVFFVFLLAPPLPTRSSCNDLHMHLVSVQ